MKKNNPLVAGLVLLGLIIAQAAPFPILAAPTSASKKAKVTAVKKKIKKTAKKKKAAKETEPITAKPVAKAAERIIAKPAITAAKASTTSTSTPAPVTKVS